MNQKTKQLEALRRAKRIEEARRIREIDRALFPIDNQPFTLEEARDYHYAPAWYARGCQDAVVVLPVRERPAPAERVVIEFSIEADIAELVAAKMDELTKRQLVSLVTA